MFQYGCEKNLYLNQLTILILEKIRDDKEPEFFATTEITEEQVESEKGCYC